MPPTAAPFSLFGDMRFFLIFFLTLGPVCAGIAFLTAGRSLCLGRAARIALGAALLTVWVGAY